MAHRVRRHFVGGRVVDLCCGYGLLAQMVLLLDDDHETCAVAVDKRLPPNHGRVHAALVEAFPHLKGRVRFEQLPLSAVALRADDVIVSAHACGSLSDDVLAAAVDVGARVAVLPCCHGTRWRPDLADVADAAAAMDGERVERLQALGCRAWTQEIPREVSPKNRLIFGVPGEAPLA